MTFARKTVVLAKRGLLSPTLGSGKVPTDQLSSNVLRNRASCSGPCHQGQLGSN
jgi:hypothetical protein